MRLFVSGLLWAIICQQINFFARGQSGLTWSQIVPNVNLSTNTTVVSCLGHDSFSNRLVLFGGVDGIGDTSIFPNATWIYDIESKVWSQVHDGVSSPAPQGRAAAYFGMLRINSTSIFVVTHGVIDDFLTDLEDTWAFDMTTYEWNEIKPTGEGPGLRNAGFFGSAYGSTDTLWLGGGFISEGIGRTIETFKLVFSSPTEAYWDKVYAQSSQYNPLRPHSRCTTGSGAAVGGDKYIMHGGCTSYAVGLYAGGPCPSDDTWVFDGDEKEWTELPTRCAPRVLSAMAPVVSSPGKAIMYGGSTAFGPFETIIDPPSIPNDEIFLFDIEKNTCTRHKTKAVDGVFPENRRAHVMLAVGNDSFIVFGGVIENGDLVNDNLMWLLSGDAEQTEKIDLGNVLFSYYHLHGLICAIAFGILLPSGFLIARYARCQESKVWFIGHVALQVSGTLFTIAGSLVAVIGLMFVSITPHGIIGFLLLITVTVQFISGIVRPRVKEDEDKGKYRKCWDWYHCILGVSIVAIGFIQITLGVFLIIAPLGVWVVWITIMFLWIVTYIGLEAVKWIHHCCCKPRDEGSLFGHYEMK